MSAFHTYRYSSQPAQGNMTQGSTWTTVLPPAGRSTSPIQMTSRPGFIMQQTPAQSNNMYNINHGAQNMGDFGQQLAQPPFNYGNARRRRASRRHVHAGLEQPFHYAAGPAQNTGFIQPDFTYGSPPVNAVYTNTYAPFPIVPDNSTVTGSLTPMNDYVNSTPYIDQGQGPAVDYSGFSSSASEMLDQVAAEQDLEETLRCTAMLENFDAAVRTPLAAPLADATVNTATESIEVADPVEHNTTHSQASDGVAPSLEEDAADSWLQFEDDVNNDFNGEQAAADDAIESSSLFSADMSDDAGVSDQSPLFANDNKAENQAVDPADLWLEFEEDVDNAQNGVQAAADDALERSPLFSADMGDDAGVSNQSPLVANDNEAENRSTDSFNFGPPDGQTVSLGWCPPAPDFGDPSLLTLTDQTNGAAFSTSLNVSDDMSEGEYAVRLGVLSLQQHMIAEDQAVKINITETQVPEVQLPEIQNLEVGTSGSTPSSETPSPKKRKRGPKGQTTDTPAAPEQTSSSDIERPAKKRRGKIANNACEACRKDRKPCAPMDGTFACARCHKRGTACNKFEPGAAPAPDGRTNRTVQENHKRIYDEGVRAIGKLFTALSAMMPSVDGDEADDLAQRRRKLARDVNARMPSSNLESWIPVTADDTAGLPFSDGCLRLIGARDSFVKPVPEHGKLELRRKACRELADQVGKVVGALVDCIVYANADEQRLQAAQYLCRLVDDPEVFNSHNPEKNPLSVAFRKHLDNITKNMAQN